jgi:8-oxo-dGTP pyrophosphatase MutT (NUDIX family)
MKAGKVRALALCVFRRGPLILAGRNRDPAKGTDFYRPIGGRIEFGERGAACARREVLEETGHRAKNLVYLGTLENLFVFDDRPGHEICLIYEGEWEDAALYQSREITGRNDGQVLYRAHWIDPDRCEVPLYPDGLAALLARAGAPCSSPSDRI